jgi:hypothetical protein
MALDVGWNSGAGETRLSPEALRRAQEQGRRGQLALSKSAIYELSRCPRRYAWARLEKREGDLGPSAVLSRGNAFHAAVAALLREPAQGTAIDRLRVAKEAVSRHPINDEARREIERAALSAEAWARARVGSGAIRYIEATLKTPRLPGVLLWGKADLGIERGLGCPTGVEVIDWKYHDRPSYGAPREADDLRGDPGVEMYRLLAGVFVPKDLRPIVVTEVHLPEFEVVCVELSDAEVEQAWEHHKGWRDELLARVEQGAFPATPGRHCSYCPFKLSCDASVAREST